MKLFLEILLGVSMIANGVCILTDETVEKLALHILQMAMSLIAFILVTSGAVL